MDKKATKQQDSTMKILFVDDEPQHITAVQEILCEAEGIAMTKAEDVAIQRCSGQSVGNCKQQNQ